jgi:hypothetical protein
VIGLPSIDNGHGSHKLEKLQLGSIVFYERVPHRHQVGKARLEIGNILANAASVPAVLESNRVSTKNAQKKRKKEKRKKKVLHNSTFNYFYPRQKRF